MQRPKFDESKYPILLDSWDNPIIFVPGSGLSAMNLGYHGGDPMLAASYDRPNQTVSAPGNRPFFASAGRPAAACARPR